MVLLTGNKPGTINALRKKLISTFCVIISMTILTDGTTIEKYTREGWWDNKTLIGRFIEDSEKNPERIAIIDAPNKHDLVGLDPERISYGELRKRVDRLASFFMDIGVKKDDIISIQLPNINELLTTYLAAWRIGAAISPVPMQWRSHELGYVFKLTGSNVFVSTTFRDFDHCAMAEGIRKEKGHPEKVINLGQVRTAMTTHEISDELDDRTAALDANDISTIQWTSGTEKDPKACPMSHNNWGFLRYFFDSRHPGGILKDGYIIMNPAPLVNMTGIGVGVVPWLIVAGTMVLHHPFDPTMYFRQLIQEKVNFTLAVPAVAVAMLKHPDVDKFDLSSVKLFTQGSSQPSPWTFLEFKKRWGIESINVWGQNEGTGLFSTSEVIPDLESRANTFPWPRVENHSKIPFFKAIETKVVDTESGKEATKPGEVGELCFKSPLTIPGYYNDAALNKKAFDTEGFFRTGDLFRIVDDKRIAFFDRAKDIIIRGGFNISSAEIEDIIKKNPRILDVAAIGIPDERLGERVCVYVVPREGSTVALPDIVKIMEENGVAKYKWPERLETIKSIPRNPVGKAIKWQLRKDVASKL